VPKLMCSIIQLVSCVAVVGRPAVVSCCVCQVTDSQNKHVRLSSDGFTDSYFVSRLIPTSVHAN